ncbi:serine hydrolase domain-containing protein [Pseudofulvibacter geojedonensis]|uniref:Serine hydrolase domain-containing protein n=1 Tax=Pseudofulvibacter geojedonensis TaxID=1123758 RepID=A0ABW3I4A5_9FLAO
MPRKKIIQILLLVGTIISLYFVPWILVKAWILPLPKTIQEQVDKSINLGFDGTIVYVDQAGKAPELYTAGWHNREHKISAKPDALYKIASISKLYVAVAISKLVSNNRLSLDKTLAEYFPELKERIQYANQITLRMMVQHRSGIPNFTNYPNYWENPPNNYNGKLNLILDAPASFKPGEDYEYSNTNYLLIRQLIDKTLGYSRNQYIKDEILVPLQLNNTFFSLDEVDLDKVMSGYHIGYDLDLKTEEQGMLATAQDVGVFLRALNNGSVFKNGEQEIYSKIYKYEHSGWVPGYQSFAEYHQDIDTVIVLFNNTTDAKLYMWNLSEIILNRIAKIIKKR